MLYWSLVYESVRLFREVFILVLVLPQSQSSSLNDPTPPQDRLEQRIRQLRWMVMEQARLPVDQRMPAEVFRKAEETLAVMVASREGAKADQQTVGGAGEQEATSKEEK